MPSRFIDRHVGGNTTYARTLADGLVSRGIEVSRIRSHKLAPVTAALETCAGLHSVSSGSLLHYVADTGPLLPVRSPSVVTVHGVASRWIDTARTRGQDWVWRTRVARAIACTDRVITVSESSADDVADVFNVDRDDIVVIPHGIDVSIFERDVLLSEELSKRVPSDFILYLGNLEPRKNIQNLISAFSQPQVRDLDLPLVIAGQPAWNFDGIMEDITRSSNVIHLGFVSDDDRVALMQQTRLFAFPSLYEGFGFPVLEALAAGAAVITSDRGSLKEVAGPSMTFEDVTVDAVASGLVRAVGESESRECCLREGRGWARRFSWERSIERHIETYREVLES